MRSTIRWGGWSIPAETQRAADTFYLMTILSVRLKNTAGRCPQANNANPQAV